MPAVARLSIVREPQVGDEAEQHEGSTRWMPIRGGLVDPKHCRRMGDAVWLYLYLHNEGVFTKGVIREYTHKKAADALGLGERTVTRHMAGLVKAGYVTLKQRQHDATVTISRYGPVDKPDPVQPGPPEVAILEPSDPPEVAILEPSGLPEMATLPTEEKSQDSQERLGSGLEGSQVCHPHLIKKSKNTKDDTTADAVDAVPRPAAPPPTAQNKRRTRTTPKPPEPPPGYEPTHPEARAVATVWLAVNHQNPNTAKQATWDKHLRWADAALADGIPADDLIRCLRHTRSHCDHVGKSWHISDLILSERIGPWQHLPGKPTTYQEPSKPERSNGRRRPVDEGHMVVPPKTGPQCQCGAFLDGEPHRPACFLWDSATPENYVDAVSQEVVYSEPRFVRQKFRADFLLPEDRAQFGLPVGGEP